MMRWIIGAVAGLMVISGCQKALTTVAEEHLPNGTVVRTITKTIFEQDYSILNVLAGLCSVAAVGCVIGRALGAPIPVKSAWACILCAAGCWMARIMLVKYLWVFALLSTISLICGGMAFAYGHRAWLERKLHLDLDGKGGIGNESP